MKKSIKTRYPLIIFFCFIYCLLSMYAFAATPPDPSDYTTNPIPGGFIDISTTGINLTIGPGQEISGIPIEFDFQFYGITYTTFGVTPCGYITFTPHTGDRNTSIPSPGNPNNIIAPFWDSLDPSLNPGSGIYYETIGDEPLRKLIVQWDNVPLTIDPGSGLTFEVILFEGSNEIQFHYLSMTDGGGEEGTGFVSGSSATIGVENEDGTRGTEISFNRNGVVSGGDAFSLLRGRNAFQQGSLLGDLNNDKMITILDQSLITDIIIGKEKPYVSPDLLLSDIAPEPGTEGRAFGDGRIDGLDHYRLFQALMGREILNPVLSGLSLVSAIPGETLGIYGGGFNSLPSQNRVIFTNVNGDNLSLPPNTISPDCTELTVTIPTGLAFITSVHVGKGNLLSNKLFFILENEPVITSLTPGGGEPGDTILIKGHEFGFAPEDNRVSFNGVQATVLSSNSEGMTDELMVIVPPGAPSGPVTVTANTHISNSVSFHVGFIKSPVNGEQVTGMVPIILVDGLTLYDAVVEYWPVNNPNAFETLVSGVNTIGGDVLGELDTTLLKNGSYVIRVTGRDDNALTRTGMVMVTVSGEYKPGRVRFSIIDMTIPVAGIPITIGRTYDSLERNDRSDFGYGWSLAIGNPKLEVDPAHNVTLTMPNGKRNTFYFTPQFTLGFGIPHYTAEPGQYGTLESHSCGLVVSSGGSYFCFPGGPYQESVSGYTYTDPYGRKFELGTDGTLGKIEDLQGNTITFTPTGITSSSDGLTVTFERDPEGKISKVTDPSGNEYGYEYNSAGELVKVTYPDVENPIGYEYYPGHYYKSTIDPGEVPSTVITYYPDGKIETQADALGNITRYDYDTISRKIIITNPDGGIETEEHDRRGNIISKTDALGNITTYSYDGNENLLSFTDPLGNTTIYTYDGKGNKTSKTDPLGNIKYTSYNQYSGPISETDELGNIKTIHYNEHFMPDSVSDGLGLFKSFTWNTRGDLLSLTDGEGNITRYEYDRYGNKILEIDPLGHETRYTYDLLGRLLSVTDPNNNATLYEYDAVGNKIKETDALNNVTEFEYDVNGNLISIIDPALNKTEFIFNRAHQKVQIIYPDATSEGFAYDWRGNLISQTDQTGTITRYVYDLAGQLISTIEGAGTSESSVTSYSYDAAGQRISETDPLGNTRRFTYDAGGQLISVTDALGNTSEYEYDAKGRDIALVNPLKNKTSYDYDIRNRLTEIIYPDETVEHLVYNGAGNQVAKIDQAGKRTGYEYDPAGRLTAVINPLLHKTSYQYDPAGNVISITDANNHTTTFMYDALNRKIEKIWPDGSHEVFAYDYSGNVKTHTLADGNINSYNYNNMNKLTGIEYFDGEVVSFAYNPEGFKNIITDSRGSTRYDYDHLDRIIQITTPEGNTLSYTYDAAGNRLSMTTAAGVVSYTYDTVNQLIEVINPDDYRFIIDYDEAGRRTHLNFPNGISTDYAYDHLDRITNITHKKDNVPLASYSYTLGVTGNRLKLVETDNRSTEWAYDDAYRLTGEIKYDENNIEIYRAAYTYDPAGNRLSQIVNGTTTLYDYNILDEMLTAGSKHYSYDKRGNLISIVENDTTIIYNWNAADYLGRVLLPDGKEIQYTYDYEGRRVSQIYDSEYTAFLWDETSPYGDIVMELDSAGSITVSYVPGETELLAQKRENELFTYHYDAHSGVRALADLSGDFTNNYTYSAFGEEIDSSQGTINPYRYTGQYYDSLVELYNLRARLYHSGYGRFVSRDRMAPDLFDPVELNRYQYGLNNPINFMDPTGYMAMMTSSLRYIQIPPEVALLTTLGLAVYALYTMIECELIKINLNFAKRSPHPPGKRIRFNTKKGAREAAQRAGKGKPVHHPNGEHGPHYHPGDGKGNPLNHDHYYYPK